VEDVGVGTDVKVIRRWYQ